MSAKVIGGAAALLLLLSGRKSSRSSSRDSYSPGKGPVGKDETQIRSAASRSASFFEVPLWVPLTMASVESDLTLSPRRYPDRGSTSWRPYGIKTIAAADELDGLSWPDDEAEIAAALDDLQSCTDIACHRIWRGLRRFDEPKHGLSRDELLRIWWVRPVTATKGPPWPSWVANSLARWRQRRTLMQSRGGLGPMPAAGLSGPPSPRLSTAWYWTERDEFGTLTV